MPRSNFLATATTALAAATAPVAAETCSKFTLCVLRTQIGKTFAAIERINTEIDQDDELGRSIHYVFTMNTLFNNEQFAKRLQQIEDKCGKGSICVFASKYSGPYVHVKSRLDLLGLCFEPSTCPRVVIMCSNKTRFDDGFEFLKAIDKYSSVIHRAFGYYDELHEYLTDRLRDQIEEIHECEKVKGIVALTATPGKIFKESGFWSRIRQIYLDNLNDTNYAGCGDMTFHLVDDFFASPYVRPRPRDFDVLDEQMLGFIDHVLTKHPGILAENTRTFIPAHVRRSGHDAVRELIFARRPDAVVIVINGVEKTVRYRDPSGDEIVIPILRDGREVCDKIADILTTNKLQHRPIVFTGFLCVGMGQTLTHELIGSFTAAIFGHLDLSNDDIYQLFGRITGRIKHWSTYVKTNVYCPTIVMHRCTVMEECAKNMAHAHNGEVVDLETYMEPMYAMGEAGAATLANVRVKKTKKVPVRSTERSAASRPAVVIPLSDEGHQRAVECYRRKQELWKLIREIRPDVHEAYSGYKMGAWNANEPKNYKKWCVENLLKEGAYSTNTNIDTKDHGKDILLVYLHKKKLILQPWNGTAIVSAPAAAQGGAGARGSASAPAAVH